MPRTCRAVTPDYNKDLMMNPGDRVTIHMHDTKDGFRVDITDNTTHKKGSMTASTKNGFGHILYQPDSRHLQHGAVRVPSRVQHGQPAREHLVGPHLQRRVSPTRSGTSRTASTSTPTSTARVSAETGRRYLDEDDGSNFCVPAEDSLLIKINGCFFDDEDFDGQSYQNDWPGTNPNAVQDAKFHPTPVLFTSPLIKGKTNYSNVVFEADLPRIEAADSQFNPPFCNRTTGENCVNPPAGAAFYPFYTTRMDHGTCTWQEGGNFIPGTINHFGGSSTTAYGPLLLTPYQVPITRPTRPVSAYRYNNFQNDLGGNPCPVTSSTLTAPRLT